MTPRLASWLLQATCPAEELVYVLAELEIEYETHIVPERGLAAGRRWFWSQTLRSIGSLIWIGLRRGNWEYALLAIGLASAGSAVLMEKWWQYILCQIPLKADLARGEDFVILNLVLTAALGFFAGTLCSTRGLVLAIPAAWAFSLLCQAAVPSVAPAWMSGLTLVTLTVALAGGAWLRDAVDKPKGGRFA